MSTIIALAVVFTLFWGGTGTVWGQTRARAGAEQLERRASEFFRRGDYAEAARLMRRSLALTERGGGRSHPATARALNNLAVVLVRLGKYEKALPLHRRALAIAERELGPRHPDTAIDLDNLALVYKLTGRAKEALPLYRRAFSIRARVLGPGHPDVATSLNNLAALYSTLGDYPNALLLQRRALAIQERTLGPEHPQTALTLNNLAVIHSKLGKYTRALSLYERALAIQEKTLGSDHLDTAISLNNLGDGLVSTGEYAKALSRYEQAFAIREKALGPEHPDTATSLNNLAMLWQRLGDTTKAATLQQRAAAIVEKTLGSDHPATVRAHKNLADIYTSRGEYAKALPLYRRLVTAHESKLGPNSADAAAAFDGLARLYDLLGDTGNAAVFQQRALGITERLFGADHPDTATALNNLALLHHHAGEYAKALRLLRRALTIREQRLGPMHPDTATSLSNLAWLYESVGDYPRALTFQRRALAIKEKIVGPEHPDTASSLHHLAALYHKTREYPRALQLYERACAIRAKRLGPAHPETVTSLNNLATLYMSTEQPYKALEMFQRAVTAEQHTLTHVFAVTSERQKLQFLRTSRPDVIALSLIRRHLSHDTAAVRFGLDLILQRKGIVFDAQALIQKTLATTNDEGTTNAWRRVVRLRSELSRLQVHGLEQQNPEAYSEAIATLQATINREEEGLAQRSGVGAPLLLLRPITASHLAPQLPKDSALVEFVRIQDWSVEKNTWAQTAHYLAFVLTPNNQVSLADLGDARVIEETLAQTLATLNDPGFHEDIRAAARRTDTKLTALYTLLIQPLEAALGSSCTQLIVSPDGELNHVPFAALRTPEPDGDYLIERMTVSYVASGRDLLRNDRREPSTLDLLVIASPDFNGRGEDDTTNQGRRKTGRQKPVLRFSPLPATAEEAYRIAALLSGSRRLLIGGQATEAALRSLPSPHILHLATHGFFLRGEGQLAQAGLALTGANVRAEAATGDDGILTTPEISGLNLHGTDLVVLSACDTARGTVKIGEGVYGLRRAFFLAGARNVVMSLWGVNDTITLAQMEEFYRAYTRGLSAPHALREAQLQTLSTLRALTRAAFGESLAPVQLWAPFIAQQTGGNGEVEGHEANAERAVGPPRSRVE
jgi:CHAT domain-containing protein/Tfp pilus assembly protein PilF